MRIIREGQGAKIIASFAPWLTGIREVAIGRTVVTAPDNVSHELSPAGTASSCHQEDLSPLTAAALESATSLW